MIQVASGIKPIEDIKEGLYRHHKEYKKFNKIAQKRVFEIYKDSLRFLERIQSKISYYDRNYKLGVYIETLLYLSNPSIYNKYQTYDERLVFLILTVDPELRHFQHNALTNTISDARINSNPEEKSSLEKMQSNQRKRFEKNVRSEFQFLDKELLRYEKDFFNKFFKDERLLLKENVKVQTPLAIDTIYSLATINNLVEDLSCVSDERCEEIKMEIETLLSHPKIDINTLLFHLKYQNELLKLKSLEEIVIFLIELIDPNLDLLAIYEEESIKEKMEIRALNEIGFFNINLIKLEKKYYEKIKRNNKSISSWL